MAINTLESLCMFIIRQNFRCLIKGKHILLCNCLIVLAFLCTGCFGTHRDKDLSSPRGYNLNQPAIIKLPSYLDEVSGIAYYPKDKSVFAINDEKGWLYKIFLTNNMGIQRWKYAKGDDFEDLVRVDSTFYVLQSSGTILSVRFHTHDSAELHTYALTEPGKNEFEILYHDEQQRRLIMLCKDCVADDKNSLSAWAFDLSTLKFSPKPCYVIDVRKIEDLMGQKKVKFKPSAAAINPATGKLFIISSINKVLVVADQSGIPEEVHRINRTLYKQPEGMTFTPDGDLLISNESADVGAANILIYKFNKGQ
jgi:hypothetical protein